MNRQQSGDPTTYGPYSQAYGYDQWGNHTHREGWGGIYGTYTNDNPTFTSNRQNGLSYDGSGNLANDGYQSYTYDATGQQAYASGTALTQSYDGNGLRAKKVDNGAATYYLRSSVLGGQVLAEINSAGSWTRGYVYAGGQMIAVQAGGVNWVHQDPVTKSQRVTDNLGNVISVVDLDPWGGETAASTNQAFQPHRFTSYERDGNGGDEAMIRRYTGKWHRFYQPDPYDGSYDLTNRRVSIDMLTRKTIRSISETQVARKWRPQVATARLCSVHAQAQAVAAMQEHHLTVETASGERTHRVWSFG